MSFVFLNSDEYLFRLFSCLALRYVYITCIRTIFSLADFQGPGYKWSRAAVPNKPASHAHTFHEGWPRPHAHTGHRTTRHRRHDVINTSDITVHVWQFAKQLHGTYCAGALLRLQ